VELVRQQNQAKVAGAGGAQVRPAAHRKPPDSSRDQLAPPEESPKPSSPAISSASTVPPPQ